MNEDRSTYNPWPLGKLPKEFQRPEIDQLRAKGYKIDDPREANALFEKKLCDFTGAKYDVLIDNCTDANFLSLAYEYELWDPIVKRDKETVVIPARTYISVPQSIIQAKFSVRMVDYDWSGIFRFDPFRIYDAAARFTEGMYIPGTTMNLSFQIKKRLPIGKGGAILCDNIAAAEWYRKMTMQGRNVNLAYDQDIIEYMGYNMYMTPEDAARGILLFDMLTAKGGTFEDTMNQDNYTDLRLQKVFNE